MSTQGNRRGVAVDLHGRTALVTGASRGIGRATALRLAEAGADVVVGFRTDEAAAARTRDEAQRRGARASCLRWDFENGAGPGFAQAAHAAGGPFDIVIHSAGIDIRKPLQDYSRQDVEKLIRVNLQAPFELSQHASDLICDSGSLVFISSTAAQIPLPMSIPYGMTKAGLENLIRVLSVQLDPRRIRVNGVAPGAVDTDLQRDRQRIAAMRSDGRAAGPADIADVALFLASPLSRWVNGQVITATGRPL